MPFQGPDGQFRDYSGSFGFPGNVGTTEPGAQVSGDIIINTFAGEIIQIRNFNSTVGPVTIAPSPGGTVSQSVVLNIQRLY
jgi:hypothetical protein